MDFFQRQEDARKQTARLVFYFCLSVLLTVLAVYFATVAFILYFKAPSAPTSTSLEHQAVNLTLSWVDHLYNDLPFDPQLFLIVTLLVGTIIMLGCFVMVYRLSNGGPSVALMLGGRLVDPGTTQADERRLRNIVEEMALASGLPVPEVYILENEAGINAFAAGYGHSDAVIGVTRGTVEKLTRDELQGVIGHEFSHILNGDMTLNMRLSCMTHGILFIAQTGYFLLRILGRSRISRLPSSGSDRSKGGPLPAILLILAVGACLVAIGSIGYFFSSLIKAAISRQREFLADAASVQFTRNPGGIAGALKKIGGFSVGSRITSGQAADASHFFFSRGVSSFFDNLFSTHPPLSERIRAIDPSFDGELPSIRSDYRVEEYAGLFEQGTPALTGFSTVQAPGTFMAQIGQLDPTQVRLAATLKQRIPPRVLQAAYEPYSARALILGILLQQDPDSGSSLDHFSPDYPFNDLIRTLAREIESTDRSLLLPIIDLSIPALKQLSEEQYRTFQNLATRLIERDASISLFEYCLLRVIRHHLEPHFTRARIPKVEFQTLSQVMPQVVSLLGALAWLDTDESSSAERAFLDGTRQLNITGVAFHLPNPSEASLVDVDRALDILSRSAPTIKKNILYACATVVMHDGVLEASESELLRAIADSLDCPIPPFARPLAA